MPTATVTADDIVRRYAADIAYVSEDAPAADLDGFIGQLDTAVTRYDEAGINGHEDVETASTLLAESRGVETAEARDAFLRRADQLLRPVGDMTGEYRDMVGD